MPPGIVSSPISLRLPLFGDDHLPQDVKPSIDAILMAFNLLLVGMNRYCGVVSLLQQYGSLDAAITIDMSVLINNMTRCMLPTSENIANGAMITVYDVAGVPTARNANATDGTKPCMGFCNTAGGVLLGNDGEFNLGMGIAPTAGATIGQPYWLSTVNGVIANAPAVAAGNIEQFVGWAFSATKLFYNCAGWIRH